MKILGPIGWRPRREAWGLVQIAGSDRLVRVRRGRGGLSAEPVVAEAVASARIPARRVAGGEIVYPLQDLSLQHERMSLPTLNPELIDSAVRHQLALQQGNLEDLEVSSTEDPCPSIGADRLVIAVSSAVSQDVAENLTARGYHPRRFLSPATALTVLLCEAGTPELRAGNSVLLHLGETVGSAAFVSDGALVLGREFRIDVLEEGEEPGPLSADAVERILEEVDRSLLLFNHKLSGRTVNRILLSSDQYPTESLRRQCEEKFGIHVEMLFDGLALDTSGFGTDEIAQSRAAQWILPIAAAVADLEGAGELNLLPADHLVAHQRQRRLHVGIWVVLILGLAMSAFHASRVMNSRALCRDLLRYQSTSAVMAAMSDELLHIQAARRQASRQLGFLSREQRPLRNLQHVLALLSRSATDSLMIDQLTFGRITEGEEDLAIQLRGHVVGPTSATAQSQFNAFWERLAADPVLGEVEVMPLSIRAHPQSAAGTLTFEIVGRLAAEETSHDAHP